MKVTSILTPGAQHRAGEHHVYVVQQGTPSDGTPDNIDNCTIQ